MKKLIIGALVGGIILFAWQFLSWTMLNIHGDNYQYTPNQDAIIEALSANLDGNGGYMVPNVAPNATAEEHTALQESMANQPWAVIQYHESYGANMGMNMFRGLVIDILAVFLLCWILLHYRELDMKTVVLSSLAIGITGYLVISYLNSVWFSTNSMGYLIDTIVQWGLCGIWLGYWLRRN